VAEDSLFRTFVSRPVESDDVVDLVVVESVSEVDFENRPESRWVDFFLSPNIVLWFCTFKAWKEEFSKCPSYPCTI
jgi:hypothetical protein